MGTFFDRENNLNRFVILNYQIHRNSLAFDRKECFYGITDRVLLMNLSRSIVDNDDVLLFLQNNGFDASKQICDIHIIHQMMSVLKQNKKKKKKKKLKKTECEPKPSPGFAIVTFESYKLANDAYTSLNGKCITNNCKIVTGFGSPSMTDPLKRILRDQTSVIHLNNLPWNVSKDQIKEFCAEAGKKYVAENKHLNKTNDTKAKQKKRLIIHIIRQMLRPENFVQCQLAFL